MSSLFITNEIYTYIISLQFKFPSSEISTTHFVQGYDTAVRLVNPKYYGGDVGMAVQFTQLRMRGCSFLVAGRREACGDFKTLDDIVVPEALEVGGSDQVGIRTHILGPVHAWFTN